MGRVLRLISCSVALGLAGATAACAAQVRLFAAASLADALQEIVPGFIQTSGHTVQMNFAGSGLLARQIRDGAPADVFFSADEIRVDELAQAGLVRSETRRVLLSNQLVLITPRDAQTRLADFSDLERRGVRRIAIGEPATVPVGFYAQLHLEALQLWDAVTPKLIPLGNARAVLSAVAAANADAGIVYRSDAIHDSRVRIVVVVAPADGPRITYPAVVLRRTNALDAAQALLAYLAGDAAQTVFARHGFLPGPVESRHD